MKPSAKLMRMHRSIYLAHGWTTTQGAEIYAAIMVMSPMLLAAVPTVVAYAENLTLRYPK